MSAFLAVIDRSGAQHDGARLSGLRAMVKSWGAEAPHGIAVQGFGEPGAGAGPRLVVDPSDWGERGAETSRAAVALAHGLLVTRDGATLGPHALDSRLWLVGDVRLDAQSQLRAALRDAGAALRGDECDDRLVLLAYATWGDGCVERLNGDFSFALWDSTAQRLLCARDGFGLRPLYYADVGGVFVCGNVLGAVRSHPAVGEALHEPAVVSYLQWGLNVDPARTTFADVRRLPRARQFCVSVARGVHDEREHWRFPEPAPLRYRDARQYVEHYREVLGVAVQDRLRQSRVAVRLSGGLDSTSLLATARRVSPEVGVETFTADLSGRIKNDEARLAAMVAAQLGVTHHVHDGWGVPLEHLDDGSPTLPEPCDAPLFSVYRRTAADMAAVSTSVFIGEDGDALFMPPSLLTMVRTWGLLDVARWTAQYVAERRQAPHTGLWLRRRLRALRSPSSQAMAVCLLPAVAARTAGQHPSVPSCHPSRPEAVRALTNSAWQSAIEVWRPAATGAAMEVLWPLTDARLLAFVFSIPPIPWCQRKELTRAVFAGELPPEVTRRPKSPVRGDRQVIARLGFTVVSRKKLVAIESLGQYIDTGRFLAKMRSSIPDDLPIVLRVLQLDSWLSRRSRRG